MVPFTDVLSVDALNGSFYRDVYCENVIRSFHKDVYCKSVVCSFYRGVAFRCFNLKMSCLWML